MEDYILESVIGEGGYGKVFTAIDKNTNELVAVKQMFDRENVITDVERELRILDSCEPKHKNIVHLKRAIFHDPISLVFECMDTDLHRYIGYKKGHMPTQEMRFIIREILEGLDYLHTNGVMHLDIKPANILINLRDNKAVAVRLADFGQAIRIRDPFRRPAAHVGTLTFSAPEILLDIKDYGPAADVWSAGCVFMIMLVGKHLFNHRQLNDSECENAQINVMKKIVKWLGKPTWPEGAKRYMEMIKSQGESEDFERGTCTEDLSELVGNPVAEDLLRGMLCMNPSKRMTAAQALASPFLRSNVCKPPPGFENKYCKPPPAGFENTYCKPPAVASCKPPPGFEQV